MIHILILALLIKLLLVTESPIICSTIYTTLTFLIGIFMVYDGQIPFVALLIATAIRFGLSTLYFWMLNKVDGILWWVIMILGILIGLV